MYRAGDNIKIHDVAFCLPGLVIGFNKTIFPAIEAVRQACKLKKINFFVETWDLPDNYEWVEAIKEEKENYPNVNLHLTKWKYDDIDFPSLWAYIYDKLGIKYTGEIEVYPNLFKRLIPFVIYQKAFEKIHTFHCMGNHAQDLTGYKNTPIIRVKPEFIFDSPEAIIENFNLALIKDLSSQFIQFTPFAYKHTKSPLDVMYADHVTSHSVSDIFYYSSSPTLYRIFGSSTIDTVDKFISVCKKYLDELPFKVTTPKDFGIISTSQEYFALEGSVLLKDYIDLSTVPVTYGNGGTLRWKLHKDWITIKNPRFIIKEGKVERIETPHVNPIGGRGENHSHTLILNKDTI